MSLKSGFLFLASIIYVSRANALSFSYSLGYGTGGTQLQDVTGGQNYKIQAGSGYLFSAGIVFPISPTIPHTFETQLTAGYIFQETKTSNTTIDWDRFPLEAVYFYKNTQEFFRIGWGPTYHISNQIKAAGPSSTIKTHVDNSLGWTFVVEKLFQIPAGFASVGLKYNLLTYRSSQFSHDADGSALFLTISVMPTGVQKTND